jgi:GGDEF domain-containing protein
VAPVADPLFGVPATIIAWGDGGSAMEVHRYAIETMARCSPCPPWRQRSTLRQAPRDLPTGLINRSGFLEELEAAGIGGEPPRIGVLYIDLDGFKGVNDEHGHRIGDAVLAQVGQRITVVLRPGDVVGRLGGDEFAVPAPPRGRPGRVWPSPSGGPRSSSPSRRTACRSPSGPASHRHHRARSARRSSSSTLPTGRSTRPRTRPWGGWHLLASPV